MKPQSKPKKTKEMSKRKIHFEESESGRPTDNDENELIDDDVSYYGVYFTD
jgi:hypothetical protein